MGDRRETESRAAGLRSAQTWFLAVIALVLAGWTLAAISVVAVPVVTAVFIALVVAPVDRWVSRHVPSKLGWLGQVVAMGLVLMVVVAFVLGIYISARQVMGSFPAVSAELGQMLGASDQAVAGVAAQAAAGADGGAEGGILPQGLGSVIQAGGVIGSRIADYATGFATAVFNSITVTVFTGVIIFFLALLMLVEAPRWRAKLTTLLVPADHAEWDSALDAIASKLRSYLLVRVVLGFITGLLYIGWLWLFGLDLLVVWGLLTFLLNFIPTLGSLIAGILPVVYAAVQHGFGTAFAVGAGIFVIEQIMGNFVDPRVQGERIALSPLVVLVVLLFWGWLWGIPGALLAVPMTIAILIIASHVRVLRPLALLLSNQTDMAGLDDVTRESE